MSMRDGGPASLATWRASVKARHLCIGAGLVDEDETVGIEIKLALEPRLAGGVYIAAALFGGVRCLFLRVIFRRLKKRQSEATLAETPCSINFPRSSTSVMSDFAVTASRINRACASMRRDLRSPPCCLGAKSPAFCRRARQRMALAALTPNRSAAALHDKPPSIAAITL
jgi:hypothetical protein